MNSKYVFSIIGVLIVLLIISNTNSNPSYNKLYNEYRSAKEHLALIAAIHGKGKAQSDRFALSAAISSFKEAEDKLKRSYPEKWQKLRRKTETSGRGHIIGKKAYGFPKDWPGSGVSSIFATIDSYDMDEFVKLLREGDVAAANSFIACLPSRVKRPVILAEGTEVYRKTSGTDGYTRIRVKGALYEYYVLNKFLKWE